MSESDYYPVGAYLDPSAPWNQEDDSDCHVCGGFTTHEPRNEKQGWVWSKKYRDEISCTVFTCDKCLKEEGYFNEWEAEDFETERITKEYVESL